MGLVLDQNALRRRIDGTISAKNNQGRPVNGTLTHISINRNNITFEVYNPFSLVQLSELLTNFVIAQGERILYEGKAVINNILPSTNSDVISATVIDPECWHLIDTDINELSVKKEISEFISEWELSNHINQHYRNSINLLKSLFSDLNRFLNQYESQIGKMERDDRFSFCENIEKGLHEKIHELMGSYEIVGKTIEPDALPIHKSFARREMHPLILRAPICNHTYTKPRGYAGDFEMVNMLFKPKWEGRDTYTGLVNSILIGADVAQAHRNRIDILYKHITEEAERAARQGRILKV
ncbi:MAG: hypothetical protein AAF984_02100, partial [Verrucomicrobiota bacterium]